MLDMELLTLLLISIEREIKFILDDLALYCLLLTYEGFGPLDINGSEIIRDTNQTPTFFWNSSNLEPRRVR